MNPEAAYSESKVSVVKSSLALTGGDKRCGRCRSVWISAEGFRLGNGELREIARGGIVVVVEASSAPPREVSFSGVRVGSCELEVGNKKRATYTRTQFVA